jgi:hypothetical protein
LFRMWNVKFHEEVENLNGFGIKRLRILNTCNNFKGYLTILLIISARCLKQGLSNDSIFGQF